MIFTNYRRTDSEGHALAVDMFLRRTFQAKDLFLDIDSIRPSISFPDKLKEALGQTRVMIVIIGPDWLDAKDTHGNRRLDDVNDFVRMEIAEGIMRKVVIFPLLVKGARMPRSGDLPEDLRSLATRNAIEIKHTSFPHDMRNLVEAILVEVKRISFFKWTNIRFSRKGMAFVQNRKILDQNRELIDTIKGMEELNAPKAKRIQELERENKRLTRSLDAALGNRLQLEREMRRLRKQLDVALRNCFPNDLPFLRGWLNVDGFLGFVVIVAIFAIGLRWLFTPH